MVKVTLFLHNFIPIMGLFIHLSVGLEEMNVSIPEDTPIIADQGSGSEEIPLFVPNNEIIKLDAFEVFAKEKDPSTNENRNEKIQDESEPSLTADNYDNEEVKISGLGMELLRGAKELPGEFINKVSAYRDELHDTVDDYRDKLHDKIGDYRDKIHKAPKEAWKFAMEVPKKVMNIPNRISNLWKKVPTTAMPDEEKGSRNRGFFGFGL